MLWKYLYGNGKWAATIDDMTGWLCLKEKEIESEVYFLLKYWELSVPFTEAWLENISDFNAYKATLFCYKTLSHFTHLAGDVV